MRFVRRFLQEFLVPFPLDYDATKPRPHDRNRLPKLVAALLVLHFFTPGYLNALGARFDFPPVAELFEVVV